MMLPNLRSLSSMRARMTAGFVFVLAPFLLIMSAILPLVANRVTEARDKKEVGWIVERVSQRLGTPDWPARLSELAAAQVPKRSHLALLIVNREGRLVWRSPGPGPAWSPETGAKWRREITTRMQHETKPAAEIRMIVVPAGREPMRPEISKEQERLVALKAKALMLVKEEAEAKALAEVKATGKLPVWAGKPEEEWHAVGAYGIGPKTNPMELVIFQSWSALLQERTVQKVQLLLLSLFAVLGVAGGAWFLVGRTLSPIRRLAVQASAASADNMQVRLKSPSRDAEVVELVDTLNGLLSRLAETAAVKGRFYAAASHELRTPLQALSGHLEVALSRERTAEEYETFLQEAARQSGRLTSLVQDLLLLHQLDSARPQRPKEPVDLAEVCDSALGQLAPLIEARGLWLQADVSSGDGILAIPTHAEILVRNLLENAVKYASEGGEVTVRLTSSAVGARLDVFNECPPVLGGNPEKLFEPFYRPDTARNARTGGNGLGLAICRAIAMANGWTVTLQPEARGVRAAALFAG